LASVNKMGEMTWIQNYTQLLEYSEKVLTPLFAERNKLKKELQDKGYEEAEIYGEMSEQEPVLICIANVESFMKTIYKNIRGHVGSALINDSCTCGNGRFEYVRSIGENAGGCCRFIWA